MAAELGVTAFRRSTRCSPTCDALSIVVPTPAHHAVAEGRARGGQARADREADHGDASTRPTSCSPLAQRTGVLVQIGHIERFNRAIRAALPYVDHPLFIDSDRLAPFNPRGSDVAVVLDLMIHDIDLAAAR